jgi:putative DNA primase/helicase
VTAPTITVEAGKRHIAADQGIAALAAASAPFYQRNRKLVRIGEVKAKTSNGRSILVPGIVPVDQAMMERTLGEVAIWQRFDLRRKKLVRIDPPPAVATQILSMLGYWPFAPLRGIIQCPTLRPNGSLLNHFGYDDNTGLLLVNGFEMPRIPTQPTKTDATIALSELLNLLRGFPFVGPGPVSLAVALSMLITPVVRGAMTVAPMHLVTKPLPGTGASYLIDCAAMIATGEVCAVEAMAPRYEETEKRLIGAVLNGFPVIAIDNVRELVAGDFFCQMVERPLLSIRALGSSDKYRVDNTFTTLANGNNATVADDMVRRTIRCELDANREHPEERYFTFDPLDEIRRNRGKYIAAALTIPLAYLANADTVNVTPLASFKEWSRLVREPLIWLGCADPVASQAKLRQADPHKEALRAVFAAWRDTIGTDYDSRKRVSDIINEAENNKDFREAILRVAGRSNGKNPPEIDPRRFGGWLRDHRGHIAENLKLSADDGVTRTQWYVGKLSS